MRDLLNLRRLISEHPSSFPDDLTGPLPYLIENPSIMAPTSMWVRFRDQTLLPLIAARPDDPHLPKFLRCVEAGLAWRAAIRAGSSLLAEGVILTRHARRMSDNSDYANLLLL
jgi:hypothetical protein